MPFTTEPLTNLSMIDKDPTHDSLNYSVTFVDFLTDAGDAIADIEVVAEGDDNTCVIEDSSHADGIVTAVISGGRNGRIEPIRFKITTDSIPPKTTVKTILLNMVPQ